MRSEDQNVTHPALSARRRAGQAMIEYLIVAGILLAGVAILSVLIYTLRDNGHRVLELAGSEYP